MKKIKTRDIIFVCVGIAFLIFVGVSMNLSKKAGEKIAEEFYVNAKGQKWTLPDTPVYEFTASSGSYPKFLSGKIEPLKVKVGDTQKFTIRVASPSPIKSVKAITDTDTKTQELELQLVESKALSRSYFRNQPYLVNEQNELIINNTNATYAEKAIEQIVAKAEAQALVEYTYEGSWVVNDTHTKTYHTAFLALAENGDQNAMMLAWSDPVCSFGIDGSLQNDCRFSESIEGFDGGNMNLNGKTVTIESGGALVWNGGPAAGSATLTVDGTIVLSGGEIKQGALYFDDVDGDLWASDIAFEIPCEGDQPCPGKVRIKDSPSRPWNPDFETYPNGAIDCMDNEATVNPGAQYFDASGPNGWDYNCSGSIEGGWNEVELGSTPAVFTYVGVVDPNDERACSISTEWAEDGDGCDSRTERAPICDSSAIEICSDTGGFRPKEITTENGWFNSSNLRCIATEIRTYCR